MFLPTNVDTAPSVPYPSLHTLERITLGHFALGFRLRRSPTRCRRGHNRDRNAHTTIRVLLRTPGVNITAMPRAREQRFIPNGFAPLRIRRRAFPAKAHALFRLQFAGNLPPAAGATHREIALTSGGGRRLSFGTHRGESFCGRVLIVQCLSRNPHRGSSGWPCALWHRLLLRISFLGSSYFLLCRRHESHLLGFRG